MDCGISQNDDDKSKATIVTNPNANAQINRGKTEGTPENTTMLPVKKSICKSKNCKFDITIINIYTAIQPVTFVDKGP